jgi:hypothetical protein
MAQNYEKLPSRVIEVQGTTVGHAVGDITYLGAAASTVAGKVYVLTEDEGGVWVQADANYAGKYEGLLAIALSTTSSKGMLLRGAINIADTVDNAGEPLYLSTTAGAVTDAKPTAAGSVVRILGYGLDGNGGSGGNTIYFCPDNTYITVQ